MNTQNTGFKTGFFGAMKTLESAKVNLDYYPAILTVESEHVSNIDTLMPFNRDDFTGPGISIYRLRHAYHHVMVDKYDH